MKMTSLVILCLALYAVVFADESPCKIGDSKQDDCNNCDCIRFKDGSIDWYCTKWPCSDTHDHIKRSAEKCKIGDTKLEASRKCTCMGIDEVDGTEWACYIPPIFPKTHHSKRDTDVCQQGDTKNEECRMCTCVTTETGEATEWNCFEKPFCPSKLPRVGRSVRQF